jgi:hypothetical protein
VEKIKRRTTCPWFSASFFRRKNRKRKNMILMRINKNNEEEKQKRKEMKKIYKNRATKMSLFVLKQLRMNTENNWKQRKKHE